MMTNISLPPLSNVSGHRGIGCFGDPDIAVIIELTFEALIPSASIALIIYNVEISVYL